jgi:hypothetical protein
MMRGLGGLGFAGEQSLRLKVAVHGFLLRLDRRFGGLLDSRLDGAELGLSSVTEVH